MKSRNSRHERQAGQGGRDYRVVVLLGIGLMIGLRVLAFFLAGDDMPPMATAPPTHLLGAAGEDEFRPLLFLPINLNQADAEQLQIIPGVGPALSRRIIELRSTKKKGFSRMNDLLDVPGIGPAKLAVIKRYCALEGRQ